MSSMDAVVVEGIGNIECKKIPFPECGDNDVIILTERSGICSTDVIRSMKTGFYRYPIVPGHEFCGVVVKKGKNVAGVDIEDNVVVYPLIPCKKCVPCMAGHHNLCDTYDFLGSRSNGGHAEYVKCPSENLLKIPKNISFDEACMAEPSSVGLHASRVSGKAVNVVVMGLGPIGFFTAQWAKILGANHIFGVDRHDQRFKISRKVGIHEFIDSRDQEITKAIKELTDGQGADVIFECSGSIDLQREAISSAAKRGRIILLGNPTNDLVLNKETYSMVLRRELSIIGSWSSLISTDEWSQSLEHMSSKKINAMPVITHNFHVSEAKNVIEDMHHKRFEFSKVVFRM